MPPMCSQLFRIWIFTHFTIALYTIILVIYRHKHTHTYNICTIYKYFREYFACFVFTGSFVRPPSVSICICRAQVSRSRCINKELQRKEDDVKESLSHFQNFHHTFCASMQRLIARSIAHSKSYGRRKSYYQKARNIRSLKLD